MNKGMQHLSVSQVKQYSTCPLQWAYSRCIQPEEVGSALVFGRAFHAAAQCYSQFRMCGKAPTLEHLVHVFAHELEVEQTPIQYKKDETQLTMIADAERMLSTLMEQAPTGRVLAVEQKFHCPIASDLPPVSGVIDLIEETDTHLLVDWKTSSRKPSDPATDQLVLYGLVAEQIGLVEPGGYEMEFRYVIRTKTPQYIPIRIKPDTHAQERVVETMRRCWKGMTENVIFPIPGWQCAGCGYKNHCTQWPSEEQPEIVLAAS